MSVSSPFSRLSRGVALVAAPAVALGALAVTPAPSYAAADPTPATNGAAWLTGELTDGLLVGEFGPDTGLTIDAALALRAVNSSDATVQTIADAVATNVDASNPEYNYVSGEAFGDAGSTYSGAVAKTVVLAQAAGRDTDTFGGEDFVARLESVVSTDAADAGRIFDVSSFGDNANTIGQAFAARGLDAASSTLATSATTYLLAQQCTEGFFRLDLGASLADTCDTSGSASPSTDVTALAVLNLVAQDDDPVVKAALDSAAGWLEDTQGADGAWGSDDQITNANANSTGLAAWALSEIDDPAAAAAAEKGATNLRAHQADDFAPCTTGLSDETGAIAYDQDALVAGRSEGIGTARDQFRRTTAQALPALLVAPAGTSADRSSSNFARTGATARIKVRAVAPGQTVCLDGGPLGGLLNANAKGIAKYKFKLPNRQVVRSYEIGLTDGVTGTVTYQTLADKLLKVSVKKAKVPAGRKQKVVVKGLAIGERVRVRYQGEVVARGTSVDNHRFRGTFRVGKDTGRAKVRVLGQFGNRKGAEKFRVVKGR